jgi:hypothetical protein
MRRQATSDESRLYGASVMGVGAGAMVFHASSGPARSWGRKLDYWMIALSTAALTKVLHPSVSAHRTGASLLLTPVQPLAVTSANTIGMEVRGTPRVKPPIIACMRCSQLLCMTETRGHKRLPAAHGMLCMQCVEFSELKQAALSPQVEFWRQAQANPELRGPHRLHVASAAVGAACFGAEYLYPTAPLIHSVWHGLSAVALHTSNALVRDADRRRALTLKGSTAA